MPYAPIITGTSGIVEKPYEVSFDPRRGITVRRRYTQAGGTTGLDPVENDARSRGYSTRKIVSPVISELEITSPELPEDGSGGSVQDVVYDTWQIVGQEVQESAYYSTVLMGAVNKNDRSVIARAMKDGGKPGWETLQAARLAQQKDDHISYTAVTAVNSRQFYRQLLRGQEFYAAGQYTLRHTTNVSEYSTYNVSDYNVECLYSRTQLLAEITSGSLWVKPCPSRLVNKILSIPDQTPSDADEQDFYYWSWRKLPSTETTGANNRVDINTDYVLYLWPLLYYDTAA